MPRSGIWLRVFVGLLLAVLPPIIMVVGAVMLRESILRAAQPGVIAIVVVMGAIAWAAVLAIVYARSLADDARAVVSLAQRGGGQDDPTLGAYRDLAVSLDERNRQVAALAERAATLPIDETPRRVAVALVAAVRTVMRDPTWRLAVLKSEDGALLPVGVYHAEEIDHAPDAVGDLEQWASVTGTAQAVNFAEGPWGAFVTVNLGGSDRTRSILYAPWEGRPPPTPAETDLLTLVGHHARTALEHSLLYARVQTQADELNRLALVQADFLRGVTHDLQSPLTSIGALATELGADPALSSPAQRDLESISHQADRLRRLVSQLLIASRIEAGAFTPQQEIFAVRPLVERTWAALRADRPFEITETGSPHLAVGDPYRMEQVLWALLDNAVKYSPGGSPIAVRIASANGELSVTVQDRGAGMDRETQERAFDQFYRADDARRLAPDGSGVGLYAARGLMEAMGGTIDVDSALGAGTSITLRIAAEPSGPIAD